MEKGLWCDVHDDWFPYGCKRCGTFVKEPTKKELTEYEERYKEASREQKLEKNRKFKYYDFQPKEDKEIIDEWFERVKYAVAPGRNYIYEPFTSKKIIKRRYY